MIHFVIVDPHVNPPDAEKRQWHKHRNPRPSSSSLRTTRLVTGYHSQSQYSQVLRVSGFCRVYILV